jgi:hypothetical protein
MSFGIQTKEQKTDFIQYVRCARRKRCTNTIEQKGTENGTTKGKKNIMNTKLIIGERWVIIEYIKGQKN